MHVTFLGQPFEGQSTLHEFLVGVKWPRVQRLTLVVAWAKRSGLGRIWDELANFRAGGGEVVLIIGVSEGGATREGLKLAVELSDEAYVFHDPRRTFHPKVYLASGPAHQSLLVGSSNLTAGGLGWNYESSILIESDEPEEGVFVEARKWIDQLLAEPQSCQRLTTTLIEELENAADIHIGSEAVGRRVPTRREEIPEDTDSAPVGMMAGLFGMPDAPLKALPPLSRSLAPLRIQRRQFEKSPGGKGLSPSATQDMAVSHHVQRRWFRVMDNTAAQQKKSANSKLTGNLRLTQGGLPIDHRTYFFADLFGGMPWAPMSKKKSASEVLVMMSCVVDGQDLGVLDIRISHDMGRVSGQGNVPTVLHWGPKLGEILKAKSYIGYYVILERSRRDEFTLTLSKSKPVGGVM
ncbi:phospholipase D-like domain-containing protein [Clavibacter michiganensis]|uniref:phospholipase D-like domain-containing protein n=1 Tax=Clavibacter michiganensis TaxID=28447 RepID=UPI000A372B18|nr:phospholipase D family protein [Clavibacter michiganensis]MBE3079570.1 hypothetical protein [Clavibacter michiganensis subsp. michiganensis]MWJ42223.1 hypothetical protein [Clavibacter michiganensis subsp. michiganensis]